MKQKGNLSPIKHVRFHSLNLGIAAILVAGCSDYQELRNPTISDLVLDEVAMPEVNRISVPMPEVAPPVPAVRAEASGLWDKNTRSFFGDRRAKTVGDLVTVIIDINDRAQLRNATGRERDSSQNVNDPVLLGKTKTTDGGSIVDLGSDSQFNSEGSIRRNESIQLRVAAMIMKVLPNRNFVIAGRQEVKVNTELRELRIAGIARPVDIMLDNTIAYDKIAEARVSYGGRGQISGILKPRYGHDILEVVLPY